MPLFIGLSNLLIGVAYAGLGSLSAWETISLHRYRGWSRFGIGFSLMAASCGPHHLTHGWSVLQGESVSYPMLAATVIGLPAGLVFVLLRIEAACAGLGDRWIAISQREAVFLVGAFVAGGLAGQAFTEQAFAQPGTALPFQLLCGSAEAPGVAPGGGFDFAAVSLFANLFVTVTYGMVGWYLADNQVRRHLANDTWSMSGVSLSGVFFSCALMHVVDATTHGSSAMLVFDLIGIPASIYFLRIVKQLHNDSVMDWNRRPLIGAATSPARPSPWRAEGAHR